MSVSNADTKKQDEEYSFSFELKTPQALVIAKSMLENLNGSIEGVKSVEFRIESETPFELESLSFDDKNEIAEKSIDEKPHEILPPESIEFKLSSFLLHENKSYVVKDIEDELKNTNWELNYQQIDKTLRKLYKENKLSRQKREVDNGGSNPYEYAIKDSFKSQIEKVEKYIHESNDGITYEDVTEESFDYECDICGQKFRTGGGLGSHRHFKHEVGESERQTEISEVDEEKDVRLAPDTEKFYALSVLYNSSKPVIPKDVESRLEGTTWESDRSSISATLGNLVSHNVVKRDKRHSERGNPYEYTLTEHGEELFKSALEKAKENNVDTFEDIVQGK